MNKKFEDIKKLSTKDLKVKIEELKKLSKEQEETGSFITRLTAGPLVAGILFSFFYLIPGLIVSVILGSFFVSGCVFNAKSIECDELIQKLDEEIKNRPEQLAMEDVLKETYKPKLVKKTKTKKVEKENNNDLGL